MAVARGFFRHFAHPEGLIGRIVAWRLDISNRSANDWTVSLLKIKTVDHVLEVGFGSGKTLRRVSMLVPFGHVAGIDPSATMLDLARSGQPGRNAGEVRLRLGSMEAIPFPSASFDKAYAVQVINYLSDLDQGLSEMYRVLRPCGKLALFFEPKDKFEKVQHLIEGIYRPYEPQEVMDALRGAGFTGIRCETTLLLQRLNYRGICMLAEKPA